MSILANHIICLTGFNSSSNAAYSKLISSLGGIVSPELHRKVYCLVCKEYGTAKYFASKNNNIPIVTPEWVEKCIERNAKVSLTEFEFKLFTGLTICVSGLIGAPRDEIINMVSANGAVYSPVMDAEVVSHLICSEPVGDKYNYAVHYSSIKILIPEWVYDSVSAGKRQNEESYALQEKPMQSSSDNIIVEQIPQTLDQSKEEIIHEQTILNTDIKIPVPTEKETAITYSMKDLSVDILNKGNRKAFANEVMFIEGFSKDTTDYLSSIVLYGGGFRSHMLTNVVTIILLGEQSDHKIVQSALKHPRALIVKATWLVSRFFVS